MSSNNNGGRAKATLFVRGLPHDATNDQLEAFFSEVGPVRSCFVVMENLPEDKKDIQRHNKGYGFVQYAIPEDATRAIEELKNKKFREERILRMELALKKHTSSTDKKIAISKDQAAKNKNIKNKIKEYSSTVKPRLIIRNLSFFCKKHHLQKAFEKFGTLDYIDVPTKPGREDLGRGYGFVGFINEKDAEKAMNEMNGKKILGRVVAIDWSVPRALYKQIEEENNQNINNEDKMDVDEDENEDKDESESESTNENEDNDESESESTNENENEEGDDESDENNEEEEEEENENEEEESEEDDGIKVIMDDDESEEEDDNEDDEEDESDDDNKYPEVEEKKTLFIRNLSFDTEQDSLYEKFKKFGPLNYARITKDYETGKSRGTGFVCFHKREDAEKCLKAYEEAEKHAYEFEEQQPKGKKKESTIHSVLRPEPMLNDATAPFILDGRFLKVNIAVRRGEAEQLINATNIRKRKEDTRNMYLIREGVIFPDSDLGKQINQSELSKRITSYTSRKQMLAKNPNLFISKTRLSIRNLIASIDDKILKQKARESVIGFWKDVQNNKRKALEDYVIEEEKSSGKGTPGLKRKIVIKQAKILRSKDRIDNETKLGRSKGCGFVEFGSHADALACLRYMNNNNKIFEGMSKRTPIVEFAVENRIILKRREDRMNRKHKREQLAKANNEDENTVNLLNKKRKRGEEKKNNKNNKKNRDTDETTENPPVKKQKVEENEDKKNKKKNKKNKKNKKENSDKKKAENKIEEKTEKLEAKSEQKESKKDKKKNKKTNKKSKREQKEAKEDKQFNDLIKLHGKSNLIKGNNESSSLLKGTDFSAMKKWFE